MESTGQDFRASMGIPELPDEGEEVLIRPRDLGRGVKFTLDKLNVRRKKWLLFSEYQSGSTDSSAGI